MLCIFLIQVIGINTGDIFGSYWFNDTMPTQVAQVPLIITFYWTMIIVASYGSISRLFENRYLRAFVSSLIVVLLDYFVEPVALKLNYWSWELGDVPIQNYIAWFFISLVFSTFLAILRIHGRSVVFQIFLATQFLFFIILKMFL
jgi:putative membrane protein